MPKYGKAVWEYVFEAAKTFGGRTFAPIDIIHKVHEKNPTIPDYTIRSYVMAMAPNHHSSGHYPSTRKNHPYFNYLGNGQFRMKEVTESSIDDFSEIEEEELQEDSLETTLSLERDLESFIFENINSVELGLTFQKGSTGRQYTVNSGRIDILAKDKNDDFVVIELKAGTAKDRVLTQTLAYMASIKSGIAEGKNVRGIIIAKEFSDRLSTAATLLPNLQLKKYQVQFNFFEV